MSAVAYAKLSSGLPNKRYFLMEWPRVMTANEYGYVIELLELQLGVIKKSRNLQVEKEGYDCGYGI